MNKRYVFDTNTLVSASLFPNSKPDQALRKATETGFLFASDATIAEISEVLHRKKFDKYVSLEKRINFLNAYINFALKLSIDMLVQDCRDPKDDKFLDIALAASAQYIISGDGDLLVLHPYQNIQILTSAQFLEV